MSGFGRTAITTIALLVWAAGLSAAQPSRTARMIEIGQHLIRAAYQDLLTERAGWGLTIALSAPNQDWLEAGFGQLTVTPVPNYQAGPPYVSGPPLLVADIQVDPDGLYLASFRGARTNAARIEDIEDVASSEAWTDAQLDDALKREGARFPPDARARFMEELAIDRFAAVLGAVKRTSVEFLMRSPPSYREPALVWLVDVVAERANGTTVCYGMLFEPIGGRLTSVSRGKCRER